MPWADPACGSARRAGVCGARCGDAGRQRPGDRGHRSQRARPAGEGSSGVSEADQRRGVAASCRCRRRGCAETAGADRAGEGGQGAGIEPTGHGPAGLPDRHRRQGPAADRGLRPGGAVRGLGPPGGSSGLPLLHLQIKRAAIRRAGIRDRAETGDACRPGARRPPGTGLCAARLHLLDGKLSVDPEKPRGRLPRQQDQWRSGGRAQFLSVAAAQGLGGTQRTFCRAPGVLSAQPCRQARAGLVDGIMRHPSRVAAIPGRCAQPQDRRHEEVLRGPVRSLHPDLGCAGRWLQRVSVRRLPEAGSRRAVRGRTTDPAAEPRPGSAGQDRSRAAGDHLRLLRVAGCPEDPEAAQEPVDQRRLQRQEPEHGRRPGGSRRRQPGESRLRPGAAGVAPDRSRPRHDLALGALPAGVAGHLLPRRHYAILAGVRHLRHQSPALR